MKNHSNSVSFGLTEDQFKILTEVVFEPLKNSGAQVWIFGSRARGDYRPFSDIDVLYDFAGNKRPPSGLIYSIKESAEESRLPFKIDMVDLCDLAQSYRDQVLQDRKSV